MAAGTRVAHPLFLIPLPQRGRGSRRGGTHRASGVEGRGGTHPEARGGASSPPHPPLSPQGERGRRTRIAREDDRSGGIAREDDRSGGTARGNDKGGASGSCLSPPARGRCIATGRRVAHPLFLIPLPHRGRGSRRRPERSASGVEGRGGTHRASGVEGRGRTHPEARGGASSPPHPSLSPQGERETRTRAPRGNDRGTRDQSEPV